MKRWVTSLIKARPDLYRAVYDWNIYPHRWVLQPWLEQAGAPTAVISLLEQTTAGRVRLSVHFRRQLGLEATFWDFEEPRRRLALLPPPTLARVARFAGAVVHAPSLSRVVAKEQRRELTQRLGEDSYAFALRQGRPAVRGHEHAAVLPEAIEADGWDVLSGCVAEDPEPLRARFRLKAPRGTELFAGGPRSVADNWKLVQTILREVLSPEESRCFA